MVSTLRSSAELRCECACGGSGDKKGEKGGSLRWRGRGGTMVRGRGGWVDGWLVGWLGGKGGLRRERVAEG